MQTIDAGTIVVVDCMNPREKMWGMLLRLDAVGAVLRGLDLSSVEDWLRQEKAGNPPLIGPSTVFIPSHRLQRIYLDASSEGVASFADRYTSACGRDVREALLPAVDREERDS